MSLQKTQGMAPSSFGFEPPVTNDSGVGSSVPSKRSSKALDSSDTDAVQKTATAVKRSKKSTFDEINDFEDEIEPNLNLEAAAEVGDGLGAAADIPIRESKLVFSGVQPPYLVYPRSQYEGYRHELPKEKERIVVQFFQSNEQKSGDLSDDPDFFHQYRLDDFSIYHPLNDKRLSGELTCVSNICTRGGFDLLFDGVLSDGQQRRYVEKVPFKVLSVGNYTDLTKHDVSQSLWIQSALNSHSHSNIWYALGTPSGAYAHYWTPFVWLANFAKHFVDYLSEHEFVVLLDFKYKFSKWIKTHHAGHETFDRWFDEYGKDDFRQPVAVHRDWLWNQTCCYSQDLTTRHVWNEVLHLRSVKQAPGAWIEKTVVTPYVHECFEHMFGDKMMVVKPPQNIESLQFSGVHIPSPIRAKRDANGNLVKVDVQVKVGDVIAIQKDEGTEWQSTSNTWYAYVQSIQYSKNDDTKPYALDVIWLYAPSDTTLAKERYPFKNELFFSDHCNCSEDKLYVSDVVTTLAVRFFEGPNDGKEFFIRQKYRTGDPAFLTLSKEDLVGCRHRRILKSPYQTVVSQYQVGDTVLVGAVHGKKDILEPVEIFHFDDFTSEVHVRVLGRRITLEDASKARPNELLYTDKTVPINPQFIHRRCHIRFVYEADVNAGNIPLPYDRNGTGDCFFISSYLYGPDGEQGIQPFESDKFPQTLHQGFDPHDPPNAPILNGLDLFCGGGNFGRGIEEGGVVNMKWGVDIDVPAIHTYGANLRTPDETALYLGSINNYLRDAIRGKTSYIIAGAGEVGFISAGSPCQGFSNANRNKFSEKSLRNCSLVASVATAVDFYRPKYALLENVHGMAATRIMPDKREINVFSQLLCCLVGMGYQCQQFTLDAWSFGSPQSRTRLFLSIAAPGQRLPPRPPRSHEHPSSIRDLSLFKAPNGLKFGGRELVGPCTYPAPTSREGFDDLPFLGNNHVGICIPFPDHRISRIESWRTRTIMANVPKHGLGVHQNSWRAAMKAGRMPKGCGYEMSISEYKVRDGCKTWSRILGDGLCRTVTTTLTPQCSYTGQWVHYDQDRLITILEARRAQSFPDDEVLLGNASQAFKIVGNSVARSVALAWGLAIRYAYLDEVIEDELDADA